MFELEPVAGKLQLFARHRPRFGGVFADWDTPDLRRRVAGGKRQLLARAVGLHKRAELSVLDATAGFGRDAFTLAALGAHVCLAERQPQIAELLHDAWRRANASAALSAIAARMRIVAGEARTELAPDRWDAVYLDPMYPDPGRDAASKKELQFLRELVGGDEDAADLLEAALAVTRDRVVVKRPLKAPGLGRREPSYALRGTQSRFDIYLAPTKD